MSDLDLTSDPPPEVKVLDLTPEPPVAAGTGPAVATVPYDPSEDRELLRGILAKLLFALLAVVAIGAVTARIVDQIDGAALKDILTGVFTPLLGVFGTVTGFYFGSAQASQGPAVPPAPPAK